MGLVDKIAEPEELVSNALAYVEKLAVTSAPTAMAETKRLVYSHLGIGFREALIEANESQNAFVTRFDAKEGAQALIEKREPKFERLGTDDIN